MGKKDVITKSFMSDRRHFADAFNYHMFDGHQVIKADSLNPVDTAELGIVFANDKSKYIQRIRDLLSECIIMQDGEFLYVLLGVENESKIHYAMPVKEMIYDALDYAQQVSEIEKKHRENKDTKTSDEFLSGFTKDDRLKPVIPLTIYWGNEEWDAPRNLKEMFGNVDERILKFVNDYKLNLILPNEIEDFRKFTSEFGKAMKYIAVSKDEEAYQKTTEDEYYRNISVETARLLNECAGMKIQIEKKEEVVNMCKAWDDHEARGIAKGKEIGIAEGKEIGEEIGKEIGDARTLVDVIEKLQKNMSCSLEKALQAIGKNVAEYEKAKLLVEQEEGRGSQHV